MTPDSLNNVMLAMIQFFQGGFVRVFPPLWNFAGIMLAIDIIFVGLWILLGRHQWSAALLSKLLYWGVILHLLAFWPVLAKTLTDGFIWLGLRAGGDILTVGDFLNPSAVLVHGLHLSAPLILFPSWKALWSFTAWTNFFLGLGILTAYVVIAMRIFFAVFQFYFGIVMTSFLLPWGLLGATASFAQGAIAYTFASGYRLGILAFLMSFVGRHLNEIAFVGEPTWIQIISVIVDLLACVVAVLAGPKMAMDLLLGAPTLSTRDMFHAVGTATAAVAGMATGTGAALALAGSTAQRAITLGSAASTAYSGAGARGLLSLPMAYASSTELATEARWMLHDARSRGQAIGQQAVARAMPAPQESPPSSQRRTTRVP